MFHCVFATASYFYKMNSRSFSFMNYDSIGFDLDHTISLYQLDNVIKLQYRLLVDYLIKNGCEPCAFSDISSSDIDFIQRGLFLDFKKGNLLKVAHDGTIIQATHGMSKLDTNEIKKIYGPDLKWDLTSKFVSDMISTWLPPISDNMRSMMEFFDCQVPLVFGQLIDHIDKRDDIKSGHDYNIWPLILKGIVAMFESNGEFYKSLYCEPELYLRKCSSDIADWIADLKKHKSLFLITGSREKEALFLADYCLGENWKNNFDFIIYNAKKPGFFSEDCPFVEENIILSSNDPVELSRGNWKSLHSLISKKTKLTNPKCVYIGDNLIQDIYATSLTSNIDAVALIEEISEEKMFQSNFCKHPYGNYLKSSFWGSYIFSKDFNLTVWGSIMKKYAKLNIPSLDALANKPLNYEFHESWPEDC